MHLLLQDCYQHGTIWRNVFDKAERRAQETACKCQRERKNLAVGDNGVSFTPVTDTWLWAITESPSLQSLTLGCGR